jgi:glycosyltransferase involved in cell wall biosynthesis
MDIAQSRRRGSICSQARLLVCKTGVVRNPRSSASSRLSSAPLRHEDLICFSHLRWDFVYQRPQHLLSRAAQTRRVVFIEEPEYGARHLCMETRHEPSGVTIAVPYLPAHAGPSELRALVDFFLSAQRLHDYVAWYYTPMALQFTAHLQPVATVYDCMDELSAFAGAPPGLREAERMLLRRADLVLTGGHSLYLAKRDLHFNVHECPSGVDVAHFATARQPRVDPDDQADIPRPRIGFFGVLDERLDRDLLAEVAARAPGWHLVMIGPVVKIDPRTLPSAPNIHYLGPKPYALLPSYIAGWDVAMLPFARNEATRFISPTKTPEYLAAGKPVVSTSITDVVRPYGEARLARIADTPADFVEAVRDALCDLPADWLPRADAFLTDCSWDRIWSRISGLLRDAVDHQARGQRSEGGLSDSNTITAT